MVRHTLQSNDELDIKVKYKNEGTEKHTFWLICELRESGGGKTYKTDLIASTTNSGEKETIDFNIPIKSSYNKGQYKITTRIFDEETTNGVHQEDALNWDGDIEII